jgi:hypothetical protein
LTNKAFIANVAVIIIFGAAALTLPVLLKSDGKPVNSLENKDTVQSGQSPKQKEAELLYAPEKSLPASEKDDGRVLQASAYTTQRKTKYWILTIFSGETKIVSYADMHKADIKINITKTENGFNGDFKITEEGILIIPDASAETEYATGVYWAVITYDGLSCEITNSW